MQKFQSSFQDQHYRNVMATGEQLLEDGRLTDVVISCQNRTFAVHKFILASASPYFHELFLEKTSNSEVLELDFIQPKAFEMILKFLYAGRMLISEGDDLDLIWDILVGASVFRVPQIKFYCLHLLLSQSSLDSFLFLWDKIEQLQKDDMRECYLEFVKTNLNLLKEKESFLSLLPEGVSKLLGILNSASVQQDEILDFILLWLKKDCKSRKVYMKTLGAFIQFDQLSESNVRHLLENEAVLQKISYLAKCLIGILQRKAPISCKECKASDIVKENPSNRLLKENDVFIPSFSAESTNVIISKQESPNPLLEENESFLHSEPTDLGAMHKHLSLPESLFDKIDMKTNSEKSLFSCGIETSPILGETGEKILYVFGVEISSACLPLHKFFSFRQKCWIQISYFPSEYMYYPSICSCNGILYFCGGGSLKNKPPTNACLTFDPKQGSWKYISSMNINRCYAGLTELGGCIYAVGGFNGRVDLRSVEKYNPATDKWMFESPLPCTVQFPEVTSVDEFLCVLDGHRLLLYSTLSSRWFQGLYLPEELQNYSCKIAVVDQQIVIIPKRYPRFVYHCTLNSNSWRVWPIPSDLFNHCYDILGNYNLGRIQFSVVTSEGFYIYEPPKQWYPSDLMKHNMYFMNAAMLCY